MIDATYAFIATTCLLLGILSGVVMHRSDYCIAGMFRDLFLFGRTFMLRSLVILLLMSMVLFEAARLIGLLPLYPFPLLYSPTAANVFGGFLFGVGMVLAGGCVVGTVYKAGAGSLLSLVALFGLVVGSAVYAEIHPAWAWFIKNTTFFHGKITLPQIVNLEPWMVLPSFVVPGLLFVWQWRKKRLLTRPSAAAGYLQPWKAAVYLSLVSVTSYVLIGMPMGVTSSYAKIAGYAERAVCREHVDGLAYFRAVPLVYVHPITGVNLQGGGGPRFDAISAIQFPLVMGIFIGSLLSAVSLREFRVHRRMPWRQYLSALTGGLIMGLASRMAPTCNVWHLLGGLPIMAVSSLLFLAGLLPGAWAGNKIFVSAVIKK